MTPELDARIARLPQLPGVYIMRGLGRDVLYIGKATNLRSRVRSYFTGNDPRPFVRFLDDLLEDIEVIVTSNPKEALLLENTLIKKHRPRFNFMLRDDKNYLSLRIRRDHAWPRVELVRQIRDDGALYFGPYASASAVRQTLGVLNRHFRLRTCPDRVLTNRTRPCIQYQIKRCPAPCVFPVDRDAYLEDVHHAVLFLQGREDELTNELERAMHVAAEQLEFEQAARVRDQLRAISDSMIRQTAVLPRTVDLDAFGLHREGEAIAVAAVHIRSGQVSDVRLHGFGDQLVETDAFLASFLSQYYGRGDRDVPSEILLSHPPLDTETLEAALGALSGRRCHLRVPERGEKRRIVEGATENARQHARETLSDVARAHASLDKLRRKLGLTRLPRSIECFDISNLQGQQVVASQVVFTDGLPDRARYRRYRIRTVEGQDDFASMFEVLQRRGRRSLTHDDPLPDLILIDGGKGQLQSAIAGLRASGAELPEIASLAKSRTDGVDAEGASTASPERVFLPGRKNPVILRQNSDENLLLMRVRDEAHRFAITFHRTLRRQNQLRSSLAEIPGVGPSRRRLLLEHFGGIRRIRTATLEELEATPGVGRATALAVFAHYHPSEVDLPASVADDVGASSDDDASLPTERWDEEAFDEDPSPEHFFDEAPDDWTGDPLEASFEDDDIPSYDDPPES